MRKQRYVVRSLTGYPITDAYDRAGSSKPGTTWWVADTLNCYREVPLWSQWTRRRLLRSGKRASYRIEARTGSKLTHSRRRAEMTAAKLNAEHEEWLRGV